MMDPAEVTLAEVLSAAGYRTGLFGKWHLGDNYPMRPIDQGFARALMHKGGGLRQPADFPGGRGYYDPVLLANGTPVKTKGYCTDLFVDAAIDFLNQTDARPFFCYLAFNVPHDPLEVDDADVKPYREQSLAPERFPQRGRPIGPGYDPGRTAKVYGMVDHMDRQLGRVLGLLDQRGLAEKTIVLFLTDNGPAFPRYNAGLRGRKGTVYEGGIRAPFIIRWPGPIPAGKVIDKPAAHIDVFPTLLEACGLPCPAEVRLDGLSFWPEVRGHSLTGSNPGRALFFQWHRGDVPDLGRAFAVRFGRYKLVQSYAIGEEEWRTIRARGVPAPELFDLQCDPYEERDIAKAHPEIVADLRKRYEAWFRDVSATRGFDPPRIVLGSSHENPSRLTRQDWRGAGGAAGIGHWEAEISHAGAYRFTLEFDVGANEATLSVGQSSRSQPVALSDRTASLEIDLPQGPVSVSGSLRRGNKKAGPNFIVCERLTPSK